MKCPNCGFTESRVIDSRPTENSIRRRRCCDSCNRRFTTYESVQAIPLLVIKKDGSREVFDRNKIITGLIKSCYKRPVSHSDINAIAVDIENELVNSLVNEIPTQDIGKMVMEKLRSLDEVSYVRFASVYREFKDVETFLKELELLRNSENNSSDEIFDDSDEDVE